MRQSLRTGQVRNQTSGRWRFSSLEIAPGDAEIAPVLELIPSQPRALEDESPEACALVHGAQSMRLDKEALALHVELDEPVQSYRVGEVKFHAVSIA
jgi:hypothetical protein